MLASLLVMLVVAGPPGTGLYFEQTTVLRSADGQTSRGVRSRVWCAGRRLRLEAGDETGGPALVARLFYRTLLVEAGVTDRGGLILNSQIRF